MKIFIRFASTSLLFIVCAFSTKSFANYQESPIVEKDLDVTTSNLDKLIRDQATLNQMNDIDGVIDLLELDKQDTLPLSNDEIPVIDEDYDLNDGDVLLDDSFDDLELEQELFDEIIEIDQLSPRELPLKLKEKKALNLPISNPSVGIQGAEEQLINQLDKSDLMNIEEDVELWLGPPNIIPKLQDDIETIDDIDDIDDIE